MFLAAISQLLDYNIIYTLGMCIHFKWLIIRNTPRSSIYHVCLLSYVVYVYLFTTRICVDCRLSLIDNASEIRDYCHPFYLLCLA